MDKRKIFLWFVTMIISIITLLIIVKLVFKTENINEGKFRVLDVLITSTAELTDKTSQNGHWSLNISQKNMLSMLIKAGIDANIDRVYVTEAKVNKNKNILFYPLNSEIRLYLNNKKQDMDIEYIIDDAGNIKFDFIVLNENLLKNWEVPENVKEIICDGRIFEIAGLDIDDIEFTLSFNLNILEKNGKNNVLKVELDIPSEELLMNGAYVQRLSTRDFKFKLK